MEHPFLMCLDHTQRRSTVGRIPLNEWSARRRDLYLTHDTHNRQISMPPVGFETTISAGEVCCECRVLSGRGLCDELITRPEESYRLWCVVVCDLETSRIIIIIIYLSWSWATCWPVPVSRNIKNMRSIYIYIYIYIHTYIYIYMTSVA